MSFQFMRPKTKVRIKKNEESQRVLDELESYIDSTVEEPVRFLCRFWKDQAMVVTYAELRSLIENESAAEKIFADWFKDYSNLVAQKMTPLWEDAMFAGCRSNLFLKDVGFLFRTSQTDVNQWLLTHTAEMVTNCLDEQQKAIQYLIAESIGANMSSAETARYIRPTIGLTQKQSAANLRYYHTMKEQLKAEHPRMKPENIEQKARHSAARYAEKQHRYRAETIARTEIATAYHEGNDAAVRQAVELGYVPKLNKVWSTSGDKKVCRSCAALDGDCVGMDLEFSFQSGRRIQSVRLPPAHPRCACALKYEEVKED